MDFFGTDWGSSGQIKSNITFIKTRRQSKTIFFTYSEGFFCDIFEAGGS